MTNLQLAVRIQHVPERKRWADYLHQMLSESETYPLQIKTVEDDKHELWSGAKKTLQSFGPRDTHVLVLQDDVLPCRDLIPAAEKIMELLPNSPVTMFSPGDWQAVAKIKNLNWATLKVWRMAQCYLVPVGLIKDFLEWSEKHINPKIYFDDDRWAMYLFANEILTYATNPSLVEHLGWNQSTLTGYQPGHVFETRNRIAKNFIGFENSALDIDWSKDLDKPLEIRDGTWSEFVQNYLP